MLRFDWLDCNFEKQPNRSRQVEGRRPKGLLNNQHFLSHFILTFFRIKRVGFDVFNGSGDSRLTELNKLTAPCVSVVVENEMNAPHKKTPFARSTRHCARLSSVHYSQWAKKVLPYFENG